MKKIMSTIVGGCFLLVGATNVFADFFDFEFYGEAGGGVGSATMAISLSEFTITVVLDNTSPTTLSNSDSLINSPGIVGFGFDLLNGDNAMLENWTLEDTSGSVTEWRLDTFMDGITVDYLPRVQNVKGALYNPSATEGFAAGPNYFTLATLTLTFDDDYVAPILDFSGEWSPFVRMQNVGEGGLASLKLPGITPTPVPEPSTMIILGVCLATLAGFRLRKKK